MVLTIQFLTISCIFGTGQSRQRDFEEPPLCGKSVITNRRRKLTGERNNGATEYSSESHHYLYPYVASVQRFDTSNNYNADIFDKRLTGAFVGTIIGPTVVLVPCRCVARYMGRVGGDEQSTWTPEQFGVMAGTPWDYSPVDGTIGQLRFASRIIVHSKCELLPSLYLWDLAAMIVKDPFKFIRDKVEAAPIPRTFAEIQKLYDYALNQSISCFTVAWGWAFNSDKPKYLEQKPHPVFVRKFDFCNQTFDGYFKMYTVPTVKHVCIETAASFQRLRRTGDAGSPLIGFLPANLSTNVDQYTVLGIKSEEDDSTPDGFSLFTRIDIDLDWLWNIKRNPPETRDSANSINFVSSVTLNFVTLFVMIWNQILNILG